MVPKGFQNVIRLIHDDRRHVEDSTEEQEQERDGQRFQMQDRFATKMNPQIRKLSNHKC
jgi:hypothetical protein